MDEINVETYELYIETIVSDQTNHEKWHLNTKVGETLHDILWVGYDSKDDTWEPFPNLTRSYRINYHKNTAFHCW